MKDNKVALIGYTGTVGRKIYKVFEEADIGVDCFNTKNIEKIKGREYNVVICAAPTSYKFEVNNNIGSHYSKLKELLQGIESVKASHFILVSTQAIIQESNTAYGELHQLVVDTVLKKQKAYTIYLMDVLFDEVLFKGMFHDLIVKQWNYLPTDIINKIPELEKHYVKVSDKYWRLKKDVPKETLDKLPDISLLYPDDKLFQLTKIELLVEDIFKHFNVIRGFITKIPETQTLNCKEIKKLVRKRNEKNIL